MSKPIVDVGIRIDISDQIQDLERQLDSLSNRAGSKMTKGMADQVASIQQAIKELQAQFNSINTNKLNRKTFEDLSKGLIKQIDSIDQRTTALEQEMAALVGTMSKHVGDAFKKDLDSFSRSMATTTQNAKEAVGAIDHLYSTFNKTPNVKAHTGIDDSALEKEYKKLTSIMQIIDDINQGRYNDNPYMGSTKKLAQTLDDLTKEYLRLEDALKAPDLPIEEYNKFTLELAKTAKKIEELQYNAADKKYSDVFTLDFSGMKLQDITGRIEETLDKLSERIHDRLEEIKRQSAGITDTISAEIEKKSNGASETKRLTVPLDISTGVNTLVQRAKEIVDKTQPHLNDYPLKLQFVLQSGYSSKKTNKLLSQIQSEIDSLPEQVDKSGLRELFDSIAKDFSGDKELNIKIKANALSETEANINNTIKKIRTTVEKPMEIHPSVVMDEKVTKKLQRELNRLSKELVLDVKTINLFGKNQKGFDEVKTIVSVIDMIMSKAEETKLQTTYVWQVLVDIREILKTFSLQENIAEVKTLVDTLSDFLASIQTAYKVLSSNDLDNMFAGIQQRVQNISGALRGNNLKEIKSVLTQFEQYQKLGGTKSFKDLGGADNIQGWLSRNAKEIEGAKDWYEAGTDFAQGYVKGIQDQIPNVEEAARKMVEAALAAIKAAQDSNSPSKETEKLGDDFVGGYVKSIENGTTKIKELAREMVAAGLKGVSDGIEDTSDTSILSSVAPKIDEIKDSIKEVANVAEASIDSIEERLAALLSGKRVSSQKLNELLGYEAYPIYQAGRKAGDSKENIAKVLLQHATTVNQTSNAEKTFQSSLNETQEEIDETTTRVEKATKKLDAMTAAIGRLTSKSGSYNVASIKEVLDGVTITGTTKRGHTVRDNARRSLQTEAEWINNNKFDDANWENAYKHYLKFIQLFDIYKKNGGTKETLAKYQAYYDRIIGNADTMRTSLTNLLSKLPTDDAAKGFKEVEQASETMGNESQQEIKATAEEVTKLLVALQLAKKAMLDLSKADGVTGDVHKKMGIDEYYYDPKSKTTELTDSELALKEAIKTMNEAIVNLRRVGITLFNGVPKIINNSGTSLLSDSSLRNLYSLGKHDKNVSLIANALDKYRDTGDQEILKYIQDLASKTKFSKFKKLNGSAIKKELLSNISNILNPSEEKASVKMTQEASASLDDLVSKSQKASKATLDVSASQEEAAKSTEKLTANIKEQTSTQPLEKITKAANETTEAIKRVAYHYGNLSNGRPSHQFGNEITSWFSGIKNGGRGWGDGTGTYTTSNAKEYNNGDFSSDSLKKFYAIDTSKLNLYEQHVEKDAQHYFDFAHHLEQLCIKMGSGFSGFDENLKDIDPSSLYQDFKVLFADSTLTFEEFKAFLDEMTTLVKESGIKADGTQNAMKLASFKKAHGSDDIKTRFLKKLGYQGTDFSGTTFDSLRDGSVIFEGVEKTIIKSGNSINDVLVTIADNADEAGESINKLEATTSSNNGLDEKNSEAIIGRLNKYSNLFVKAKDALNNSTDTSDLKKVQKEVLAANNEIWKEINDSPAAAQQSWGMFFDNFKSFGTKFGMLYNDLEDRLLILSVTSQTESEKTVANEKKKQKAIEKTTATIKEQTDAAQKSESSIDDKFDELRALTAKHAKPRANAERYPKVISQLAEQYQKYVQAGGTKSIEELSKSKTVVADITTAYEKLVAVEKEKQKATEKTTESIKKQADVNKTSDKNAEKKSKQIKQHTSEVAKNTEEIKRNTKAAKENAKLSIDDKFDVIKALTSKYARPKANAENYPRAISTIVDQYRKYEQAGGTKPISELTKSKTVLADLTAEYKKQSQEIIDTAKKAVDAEEKKQSSVKKTTATIKEQTSESKKTVADKSSEKKTKQTAQHTSEVAKNTEEIKKNTQAAKENAEVSIDKKFDDLKALTSKYAKPRANAEKYPSVIATLADQYRQYVQAGGTRPIEDLSKSKTVVADLTAEYEKQTQKIDENTKSKKANGNVESKKQDDSVIEQTSLQIDTETKAKKDKTDATKKSTEATKDESKAESESANQTQKTAEAEDERRRVLDALADVQERVYKNEIHNANGSVTATDYIDHFRTRTTTTGYDKDGHYYSIESTKENYVELEKQIQRNDKAIAQLTKDMILNAHAGADLSAWENRIAALEEYNRILLKIRNNDWVGTGQYLPEKFHADVFDAERLKAQEKDWESVIAAAQKKLKEYVSETESISSKPLMSGLQTEVTDLRSALVALSGTQIDFKNPNIDIVRQQVVDFLITLTKLEDKLGDVRNKSSQNSFIPVDISEIKTQANNIQAFLDNNTAAGRRSKEVLNAVYDELRRIIDTGDEIDRVRFNALIGSAQDAEAEVRRLHQTGNSFFRSFTKQLKSANAQFFATYFSLMDIIRYIREVATTVTEVDSALTELRKVSDASTERLAQNFETSAETAKELGSSITHVINVTADWARLGYDVDAAEELARVTTLFQNVGDNMSADDASSFMISTLQGFQLATEQAEHIVDVYNEVANNFAIDTAGIGEALTRSAASFYAANTSLEKSVALVTATNEVVQNPEAVGTLWKTLSARIRGAKTELAELGEEEDEFTQTTSKLRALVKGLTGFEIMADEDTFKDVYEIILGIGEKWNDLTDIEQASLGEALAGKRNANALYAVLNNLDTLESAYKHAQESSESAAREQENYMMSIQYSLDRFTASLQELEADFLSSDLAKKIVDFGTSFINTLDEIIEHSNAFVDILGVIGVVLGIKNHQAIIGAIKDLAQFGREMQVAGRASAELPAVLAGIQANGLEITTALGSAGPIILGIAAAVGVAIVAYDAFTVSVKESQKKIDEYNDSIKTLTSELDELRTLENKTSYDNKRIEYLEKQLDIQKRLLEVEQQRYYLNLTEKSFGNAFDSDNIATQQARDVDNFQNRNSTASTIRDVEKYVDRLTEIQQEIDSLNTDLASASTEKEQNKILAKIEKLENERKRIESGNGYDRYSALLDKYQLYVGQEEQLVAALTAKTESGQNMLTGKARDDAIAELDFAREKIKEITEAVRTYEITINGFDPFNAISGIKSEDVYNETEIIKAVNSTDSLENAQKRLVAQFPFLSALCTKYGLTLEELVAHYWEAKEAAEAAAAEETKRANTLSTAVSNMNTRILPQFDALEKVYDEIFNGEKEFDLSQIGTDDLESIRSTFEDLDESLNIDWGSKTEDVDKFLSVIGNSSSTASEVHDAFDALATSYFNAAVASGDFTEENAKVLEQMLTEMGVVNAKEVVDYYQALADGEELATTKGIDLATVTSSEVDELIAEGEVAPITGKALALLALQKQLAAGITFGEDGNIDEIEALAKAAGAGAIYLSKLAKAKEIAAQVDAGNYGRIPELEALTQELETHDFTKDVKIDFSSVGGGTNAAGSAGSDAGDAYVEQFEKELESLEEQRDAGIITEKEFLDKYKALIEKYFKDVDGYGEEYAKRMGDYFQRAISYYESIFSAVGTLLDHRINAAQEGKDAAVDALNEEKDAALAAYDAQLEAIDELIDAKQDQLDQLQEEHEARQRNINLQKAEFELQKAQNQRTKLIYKGGQLVYENDKSAVRDAKENVENAEYEIAVAAIEKEIKALEDQREEIEKNREAAEKYYTKLIEDTEKYWDSIIEALEKQKSKWEELAEIKEIANAYALIQEAGESLGYSVEDILNDVPGAFEAFRDAYIGILQDANSENSNFLDGLSYATSTAKESVNSALGEIAGKASEVDKALEPLGEVSSKVEDTATALGNIATNSGTAASSVGTLSSNLDSVAGASEDMSKIDSSVQSIASASLGDTVQAFKDLAGALKDCADALGIGDGEISAFESAINALSQVSLGDESTGAIGAFNALASAVSAVTTAIGAAGGGEEGGDLTGSSSESMSAGAGGSGGLISAIEDVKEAADQYIGTTSSAGSEGGEGEASGEEGGGTAISDFDALYKAVGNVIKALGNPEDDYSEGGEDGGTLVNAMKGLPIVGEESIRGDAGVIAMFTELLEIISQCAEKASELLESIRALGESGGAGLLGQDYTGNVHVNAHANGNVHGNAYASGRLGLKKSENALVGELGQELVFNPATGTYRTVGDHGPEITRLSKGDLIFNAEQTKAIIKHGKHGGNSYANGSGLMPLSDAEKNMFKTIGEALTGIKADTSQMLDAARNIVQNINKVTTNNISPTINISGTQFTVQGVNGEAVMRQIEQSFSGMVARAYQEAMT